MTPIQYPPIALRSRARLCPLNDQVVEFMLINATPIDVDGYQPVLGHGHLLLSAYFREPVTISHYHVQASSPRPFAP